MDGRTLTRETVTSWRDATGHLPLPCGDLREVGFVVTEPFLQECVISCKVTCTRTRIHYSTAGVRFPYPLHKNFHCRASWQQVLLPLQDITHYCQHRQFPCVFSDTASAAGLESKIGSYQGNRKRRKHRGSVPRRFGETKKSYSRKGIDNSWLVLFLQSSVMLGCK